MSSLPRRRTILPTTIEDLIEAERGRRRVGPERRANLVSLEAVANLPTRFGDFRIAAFRDHGDGKEHVAIVRGNVIGARDVPTRLHSECLTGDVAGSLRCDCRDQLEAALQVLGSGERGLLLYLRQEGRGIGLVNKIRAYALQDSGLDTVDANRSLGFRDDERDYGVAAHMLQLLRVRSIRLMTNNPDKVAQLERHGICISARLPHVMAANDHNRLYLRTKVVRCGHRLDEEELGLRRGA